MACTRRGLEQDSERDVGLGEVQEQEQWLLRVDLLSQGLSERAFHLRFSQHTEVRCDVHHVEATRQPEFGREQRVRAHKD